MGSGKSIIGKDLSKRIINISFIDSDYEIEKFTKKSIKQYFEKYGEKYFRKIEEKVCEKLLMNKNCYNFIRRWKQY